MSFILESRHLCFSYGVHPILENFSCQINSGEKIAILGESGCGKTSFLRLVAGLERPKSGEIYLRGHLVSGPNNFIEPSRRGLGYVFQNFALFEKVNVSKNIHYGCQNESHNEEAQKLISLMNLKQHLDKKPHQLSGGERQKVALARSLAQKPDILLLDEPFSSIDPSQTDYLIDELKELFIELQVTALMVTHSREESKRFSDRVIEF